MRRLFAVVVRCCCSLLFAVVVRCCCSLLLFSAVLFNVFNQRFLNAAISSAKGCAVTLHTSVAATNDTRKYKNIFFIMA